MLFLDLQPSQIETDPGQAGLLPWGHQVQQGLLLLAVSVAEVPAGGFGWQAGSSKRFVTQRAKQVERWQRRAPLCSFQWSVSG